MSRRSNARSDGKRGSLVPARRGQVMPVAVMPVPAPEQPKKPEGVDPNHPLAAHPVILNRQAARVLVRPRRPHVAIIGFASSTRDLAPFDDSSYEIWTLNQLYRHVPRADRHFEIHANWNEHVVEGTDHAGWLRDCGLPIYMVECIPGLPTSVRYPIERVIQDVAGGLDYFTSTISFMIALAILEGFRLIGLWGIDLIVAGEYHYQKACAEFFLGVAHGRGIALRIPDKSALLKAAYRYGYQQEPDWGPIKLSFLEEREKRIAGRREELLAELRTVDGSLQEVGHWRELATLRLRGGEVQPA